MSQSAPTFPDSARLAIRAGGPEPMLSTVSLYEQPGAWDFAAPLQAVDSVSYTADEGGWGLETKTHINARDPHLQAHFPGFTIFPGVFIFESLRQGVASACGDAA